MGGKNKIMEPTSKNEFYSKAICTKGDVFNALYKANGSPTPKALNHFPDVKSTDSYYKAALWAVDKGLIEYGIFEGKYAYQRGYALYYVWQTSVHRKHPRNQHLRTTRTGYFMRMR